MTLPDLKPSQPEPAVMTSAQQKKAIEDLAAKRDANKAQAAEDEGRVKR